MTIEEAIKTRHSVRAYQDKNIEQEKIEQLNEKIAQINQEGKLHLQLLEDAGDTFNRFLNKAMGLSSAPSVIACIGADDATLDERVGYYGEQIVLFAQQLGLNTCWAGTYNKKKVPAQIMDNERLVIVIAIGYGVTPGRERKSKTVEQVIEGSAADMPEWFLNGVEFALLAPTAINQQKFIFSIDGKEKVTLTNKADLLGEVDKGIVKYHFEVGANRKI